MTKQLLKGYTVKRVQDEIVQLLMAKNLGVKLYHVDELAGRIEIDGDADLTQALNNFIENMMERKEGNTWRCISKTTPVPKRLYQVLMKAPAANQEAYLLERYTHWLTHKLYNQFQRKRSLEHDDSNLDLVLARCRCHRSAWATVQCEETIKCAWCPWRWLINRQFLMT